MRTIIAGSRNWTDFPRLCRVCDALHAQAPFTQVISGTAAGADQLGEQWAKSRNIPIVQMPANWDTYGKSAGYHRNEAMAKVADRLVAFWDGQSRGTGHMITLARKYNLVVHVEVPDNK